jgi:hypothetical protein
MSTASSITILVIFFAMIIGWCMNLYNLIANSPELVMWSGMEIARVIGVFVFPLGGLLGYF